MEDKDLPLDKGDKQRMQERLEELESHAGPAGLSTPALIQQLRDDARDLFKLEVELARAEAKADLNSEVDLAKGAGIAAVCLILGLNMLIVSAVFAWAPEYAWLAALIVGIVLLIVAGIAAAVGWARAHKQPLNTTRATLKEDLEWAKQQIK
jgi:uncharacterized membrane protein YqjE